MKCVCGYEEPKDTAENVNLFFKSGPRKGEFKGIEVVLHRVPEDQKFIEIRVEKDFGFVRIEKGDRSYHWQRNEEYGVKLFACPECLTVRLEHV